MSIERFKDKITYSTYQGPHLDNLSDSFLSKGIGNIIKRKVYLTENYFMQSLN